MEVIKIAIREMNSKVRHSRKVKTECLMLKECPKHVKNDNVPLTQMNFQCGNEATSL